MKYIIKRDGRKVPFDSNKIYTAVYNAAESVNCNGTYCHSISDSVRMRTVRELNKKYKDKYPTVEEVQDIIIHMLINSRESKISEAYIKYRNERTTKREAKSKLMDAINEITSVSSKDSNLKRDNGNVNGDSPMGMMLQYGSIVSKQFADDYLISKDIAEHVKNGAIYIHDKDFLPTGTLTCCQIPLDKLFENGFDTGHGYVRAPQSIRSYASLAAIAIQSNQNDQHGGQAIPLFDFYLAPGVTKTFKKELKDKLSLFIFALTQKNLENEINNVLNVFDLDNFRIENHDKTKLKLKEKLTKFLTLQDANKIVDNSFVFALEATEKETYQAMEGFVHNLNTMHSRAGAQVPFSSVNFGMDTSEEGRMVSKNLLLAQEAGLGNGETPIFPILIFQVKEGINYNPEDKNYDLFKLAMRVSAKRLFPNFVFVDAPFNLQYYDPADPETIIATMGCVDGEEVITYKIENDLYVESFERAWNRLTNNHKIKHQGLSEYLELNNVTIYDSSSKGFVKCKKMIKNQDMNNWMKIKCSGGRTLLATDDHPLPIKNKGRLLIKDVKVGDEIIPVYSQYEERLINENEKRAWLNGLIICGASYQNNLRISLGLNEKDIVKEAEEILKTLTSKNVDIIKQERGEKGKYINILVSDKKLCRDLTNKFEGINKAERKIPNEVFNYNKNAKLAFLAGMIDADGDLNQIQDKSCRVQLGLTNKELAIEQMLLAQSLGIKAKLYENHYKKNSENLRYRVEFKLTKGLLKYIVSKKKKDKVIRSDEKIQVKSKITKIEFIGHRNKPSYDVETESDYFDVSGILSHNCRTRVIGNINGKQTPVGRGNLSFTTINLPRLGIKHGYLWRKRGENKEGYDREKFYQELDTLIETCIQQLLERYEMQKKRHVNNFPFLMGQGVWRGSVNLKNCDELDSVIDTGTLSVGFIGLAECLVGLTGQHHGESERLQKIGLEIIGHMRNRMDEATEKYQLNFTLLASPAEGLSGFFTRIDKNKYGVIEGITDRDYYTNSFHIPVYYPIRFIDKIKKEAPYHALTNAGHITYVEMDGDPTKNLEAFETIIRCMKESGIGYGSINHPVDRDPICGYSGVIEGDICPKCGRNISKRVIVRDKIRRKNL